MRYALCLGLVCSLCACDRGPSTETPAEPATAVAPSPSSPMEGEPSLPANHPPVTPRPTQNAEPSKPEAAGLGWTVPSDFVAVPPANPMRKAQYKISSSTEAPELVVHFFGPGQGGDVKQNLDRWVGQVSQPGGGDSSKAAKHATLTSSGGVKVHTLDVSGTFASNMPGQASAGAQANSRLLGAIAEGPQGSVFFKVVGPAEQVGAAKQAFDALVQSIHPK